MNGQIAIFGKIEIDTKEGQAIRTQINLCNKNGYETIFMITKLITVWL